MHLVEEMYSTRCMSKTQLDNHIREKGKSGYRCTRGGRPVRSMPFWLLVRRHVSQRLPPSSSWHPGRRR